MVFVNEWGYFRHFCTADSASTSKNVARQGAWAQNRAQTNTTDAGSTQRMTTHGSARRPLARTTAGTLASVWLMAAAYAQEPTSTSSRIAEVPMVHLSPRSRTESLPDNTMSTLHARVIEPFLAEPLVVDENVFAAAAQIVSAQEGRVLLTRGDRAYARGPAGMPLQEDATQGNGWRIFRGTRALKDPDTGLVLGFEAVYVGKAKLLSSETLSDETGDGGTVRTVVVPARMDIISAKEEIRVGDRLLPEPAHQMATYTPHAPQGPVSARIVSVYGSAVANAAQNQVVVINKGTRDGMDSGTVLTILKNREQSAALQDAVHPQLRLPSERNGQLMVFRTYERLSYALVLDITDGVRVGDRLEAPR